MFCSGILNACGEAEPKKETTVVETTAKEAETDRFDGVDFQGATLKVLARTGNTGDSFYNDLFTEEINGESLNDCIYNRKMDVEKRLNISVTI